MKNTHGWTQGHTNYSLEIQDAFHLDRGNGEETKRYEAAGHADNKNRMLLWHGSRLTNFVGILSQGLRIAPPEAPVTGYMFGERHRHRHRSVLCSVCALCSALSEGCSVWLSALTLATVSVCVLCVPCAYTGKGVYFADMVSKSAK